MNQIYGPTINVRKLLYLYKSKVLSRDLFGIVMLFMLNPRSDSYKVMTKANYIALFKELDNTARIEYSLEEEWHHRRTRRARQRDKKIRMRTEIMVYG